MAKETIDHIINTLEERGHSVDAYDNEVIVFFQNGMNHNCTIGITVHDGGFDLGVDNEDLEKSSSIKTVKRLNTVFKYVEDKVFYDRAVR